MAMTRAYPFDPRTWFECSPVHQHSLNRWSGMTLRYLAQVRASHAQPGNE